MNSVRSSTERLSLWVPRDDLESEANIDFFDQLVPPLETTQVLKGNTGLMSNGLPTIVEKTKRLNLAYQLSEISSVNLSHMIRALTTGDAFQAFAEEALPLAKDPKSIREQALARSILGGMLDGTISGVQQGFNNFEESGRDILTILDSLPQPVLTYRQLTLGRSSFMDRVKAMMSKNTLRLCREDSIKWRGAIALMTSQKVSNPPYEITDIAKKADPAWITELRDPDRPRSQPRSRSKQRKPKSTSVTTIGSAKESPKAGAKVEAVEVELNQHTYLKRFVGEFGITVSEKSTVDEVIASIDLTHHNFVTIKAKRETASCWGVLAYLEVLAHDARHDKKQDANPVDAVIRRINPNDDGSMIGILETAEMLSAIARQAMIRSGNGNPNETFPVISRSPVSLPAAFNVFRRLGHTKSVKESINAANLANVVNKILAIVEADAKRRFD
jgi:hypothetical protein